MPLTVRVRNFQSIKDATLRVAGLTVITGPNNSGKTSVLRAIRGAFTNAPAGPLIRQGEGYLTVDLSFDDGQTVTWEKGHEKPDGKGKAINRYTINSKVLDGVGRGVPPEVEALGVREISGGLWPQIAKQFDGTLFLVDRPGSVVAEALSDVERVGKLSDALRASESDRRTISSEIKVRRVDESRLQERVQKFDGLDPVLTQIDQLSSLGDLVGTLAKSLAEAKDLAAKLRKCRDEFAAFTGFTRISMPARTPKDQFEAVITASTLRQRLEKARRVSQDYNLQVELPFFAHDVSGLMFVRRLAASRKTALENAVWPKSFPEVPDSARLDKYARGVTKICDWAARRRSFSENLEQLDQSQIKAKADHAQAVQEAHDALHAMGECPTCGHGT
jgi:DNA repair exonuclease SbcCD ATPase subunit